MSNVFDYLRRRTLRAPINPMDRSTVVSILPKRIDEVKHTIQPGRFILEPGSYDKPSILVVGPSSWWKEIDQEQDLLEITNGSIQVANSIVVDYCNGLVGCNMEDSMPGLFYVPGSHDLASLKKNYQAQLDKARDNQKRWYQSLVRVTDSLWISSKGHPLSVSTDAKLAASELGLVTKEWMKDSTAYEMVKCVACGALRNPEFPVCGSCKAVVDKDKAKLLNLQFAS